MDTFSRAELRILLNENAALFVSIFLPTHRTITESRQDPVMLKTLLREAQERLLTIGLSQSEAAKLLMPVRELEGDSAFCRERSDGLALFLTADSFHQYRVPLSLPRLVFVGGHFHVRPLLPLLDNDYLFYVLAFSQNDLRLLRATRYQVKEVELGDCPRNLAEALRGEESGKQLQYHTFASGDRRRIAVYHGQGARVDTKKDQILRYLRRVDLGLHELLRNEQAPLILAADENLFPIYREANSYPYLMTKGVAGNPELMNLEDLHQSALKIVEPEFQKARDEAVALFKRLAGSPLASSDVAQIVRAAYQGRVGILFVPSGQGNWGVFDPDTDTVTLHEERQPDDDDLVDLAAYYTLKRGGMTYADEAPLAAIFRC